MTSERKIIANGANAKASTGPRSARGKRKAAQNSRRHGLSTSISADPAYAAEAKKFAREIAGKAVSVQALHVAERIGEANVDLVRIRKTRHELLSKQLPIKEMASLRQNQNNVRQVTAQLLDLVGQLESICRYERRALSRRKFAIRELNDLRRETE